MSKTMPIPERGKNSLGARQILTEPTIFEGRNGTRVEVDIEAILSSGGEALIYKAHSTDGKNESCVLKYYDRFDVSHEQDFTGTMEFLMNFSASHPEKELFLVPIDYGIKDGHAFEILPLLPNPNIPKKFSYKELRTEIIPLLNDALHILHENGICHRDVKPSNILISNGHYVLADFGTACKITNARNDLSQTIECRQSVGYSAPEIGVGVIAKTSSDIFSIGATVSCLYLGRHTYEKLLESQDYTRYMLEVLKNGFPMHCKKSEQDLQRLVDHMCYYDPKFRISYSDICKWLDDKNYDFDSPQKQDSISGSSKINEVINLLKKWSRKKLENELTLPYNPLFELLKEMGYGKTVSDINRIALTDPDIAVNSIFRILEDTADESLKKKVMKLYSDNFSPYLEVLWLRRNLNTYSFSKSQMSLRKSLEGVDISSLNTVEAINKATSDLLPYYQEFTVKFENDPYSALLNLEPCEISPKKLDGCFEQYIDKMLPIGLIKHLKSLEA